jgi:hypothetical protein
MTVQTRPQVSEARNHKVEMPKVRGGAFTTWLVLVLVANTLVICFSAITLVGSIILHLPFLTYWSALASLIVCTVIVISTVGIFMWKKWGFYLFLGTACCAFLLDIVQGQIVVVSHFVVLLPNALHITNTQVYITWPLAIVLMWILVRSKKRWPMFY